MTVAEIRELLREADEAQFAVLERSLAADQRKGVKDALAIAARRLESQAAEQKRLKALYTFEKTFCDPSHEGVLVGLDEVGRGAVAGPLAVGAVVLDESSLIEGLNDSKQLSAEAREVIAAAIKKSARAWTVEFVDATYIDQHGMTAALKHAFSLALSKIESAGFGCSVALLDGNPLGFDKREVTVVKGDARCASIAAASIVAKVTRDQYMVDLDSEYPAYDFIHNKGYASSHHIEAIREHGLSAIHRKSFCKSFMQETLF